MRVLILGATSAISQEVAKRYAKKGAALFLVARRMDRLEAVAANLKVLGAKDVSQMAVDLNECDRHVSVAHAAESRMGGIDVALICYGSLGDQKASERDGKVFRQEWQTNFLSQASLLTILANRMEGNRGAVIAAVSSVAGDRGRQSNYVYGAAKAALSAFLQGLRNRLQPAGVAVVTIKPGFVDSPMTANVKKNFLFASPATVARGIERAISRRKNVVYLPWFWRYIMLVIRSVPETIFKRLKL